MTGKLGSKFGQVQKSAGGASKSDPEKCGTRAAIGLRALGALALGVDGMGGGIFDGADGAAGGDFGFSGGGDVPLDSSSVDASYA
jgi:hypothetical protein